MKMSRPLLLSLVSLLVLVTACGGRARERLSEVETVRTSGNDSTILKYEARYAKDGTLDEVEQTRNGELLTRMTLSYADGRVASIEVEDDDGDRTELELRWEEGQLVEIEATDGDGDRWSTELEYLKEEPSKLERTTKRRELGAETTQTVTTTYDWDEGRLVESDARVVTHNDILNIDVTTRTRLERRYGDGGELTRLNQFLSTGDNTDAEVYDFAYENGRLVEVEEQGGPRFELVYDDFGRLAELEETGGGARAVTEYSYEDGSVAGGVVFTPVGLPNGIQFDLHGRSFSDLELLTFEFLLGAL